MWGGRCSFSCWLNKRLLYRLQLVCLFQSTSNAGLRARRSSTLTGLLWGLQRPRGYKRSLLLSRTWQWFLQSLKTLPSPLRGGSNGLSGCGCVFAWKNQRKESSTLPQSFRSSEVLLLIQQTFAATDITAQAECKGEDVLHTQMRIYFFMGVRDRKQTAAGLYPRDCLLS